MKQLSLFLCLFCFLMPNILKAQEYAVAKLDPKLVEKASAVIRLSEESNVVDENGKITRSVKIAYTIFKAEANDLAETQVNYSKSIQFKNLQANVYDAAGKLILKSKKSDIKDYSNFSSFSIYEDNRQKVLDMKQYKYPYTVEFLYEVQYPNLYYISSWYPQPYSALPVESASVTYDLPKDKRIRFYSESSLIDANQKPTVVSNRQRLIWSLENLQAIESEKLMPRTGNYTPVLYAAPSEFDYDGYKGDLSTWDSYGSWIGQLNKGKDVLNATTKAKVKDLTEGLNTDFEKIKALYQYMQNHTRYVSIQLGIGGLRPFEASTVEKLSYGDCKALSNYMGALLKEAGINSHYALIHGGDRKRPTFDQFPMHYFNHVILAVPLEKDTLWLECTSQTNPIGYLGRFTADRQALLINDHGGRLVKTPRYSSFENTQLLKAEIEINENGTADLAINMINRGLQSENFGLQNLYRQTDEQRKKWFNQNFTLSVLQFESIESALKNEGFLTEVETNAKVKLKNFTSLSGNRIFLSLNTLNPFTSGLSSLKGERKYDFESNMGFLDNDQFEYKIPAGFVVEKLPESISIENQFGTYKVDFKNIDGIFTYIRSFQLYDGVFPADVYENYVQFLDQVEKADKVRVVLVRQS
ncbi:DUF3857 domain-containing protein [Belliella kenyensis]|uniref:DUF3857 domain-containing protein n=1 Tax=Belliella kenyensis TaxID=1472724 RepID=A0ABV8EJ46_9BACT|nr:DUF3857 domain-containing protein [Belliella kenyensis]MCH7400905.1 DUF3857 and transglutaminase domain-containing protein [Belliella kenyensis]MDN3603904.1 DUF3857 domain-containing protein [Belliella kenyensis]